MSTQFLLNTDTISKMGAIGRLDVFKQVDAKLYVTEEIMDELQAGADTGAYGPKQALTWLNQAIADKSVTELPPPPGWLPPANGKGLGESQLVGWKNQWAGDGNDTYIITDNKSDVTKAGRGSPLYGTDNVLLTSEFVAGLPGQGAISISDYNSLVTQITAPSAFLGSSFSFATPRVTTSTPGGSLQLLSGHTSFFDQTGNLIATGEINPYGISIITPIGGLPTEVKPNDLFDIEPGIVHVSETNNLIIEKNLASIDQKVSSTIASLASAGQTAATLSSAQSALQRVTASGQQAVTAGPSDFATQIGADVAALQATARLNASGGTAALAGGLAGSVNGQSVGQFLSSLGHDLVGGSSAGMGGAAGDPDDSGDYRPLTVKVSYQDQSGATQQLDVSSYAAQGSGLSSPAIDAINSFLNSNGATKIVGVTSVDAATGATIGSVSNQTNGAITGTGTGGITPTFDLFGAYSGYSKTDAAGHVVETSVLNADKTSTVTQYGSNAAGTYVPTTITTNDGNGQQIGRTVIHDDGSSTSVSSDPTTGAQVGQATYDANHQLTSASGVGAGGAPWTETISNGQASFSYGTVVNQAAGQAGLAFGSVLGTALGGNSLAGQLAASTVLGTFTQSLAQAATGLGGSLLGGGATSLDAFDGALGNALSQTAKGVTVTGLTEQGFDQVNGHFEALLFAEAGQALGLKGFGAQAFTVAGTTVTNQIETNILTLAQNPSTLGVDGLMTGFNPAGFASQMGANIGGALCRGRGATGRPRRGVRTGRDRATGAWCTPRRCGCRRTGSWRRGGARRSSPGCGSRPRSRRASGG